MGIRLKETKDPHKDWLVKTIGKAWLAAYTVSNESKHNIQVHFVPKQWKVVVVAYGQKFIGIHKDNEQAMIDAFEKFAQYSLAIIDYQEKNKHHE